jgi:phosphatidylethanolamine-binding protein (PEBP) family uncharacterized protein
MKAQNLTAVVGFHQRPDHRRIAVDDGERAIPRPGEAAQRLEPRVDHVSVVIGRRGWNGPCPPRGRGEHRYIFTLFALSEPLGLAPGASAKELRRALRGRVLAEGRLTGRYGRA